MKTYYKRHLPHIQLPQASYFITFRLANTIPVSVIQRLRAEQKESEKEIIEFQRRLFYKIDDYLDRCNNNNYYLRTPAVAKIVSAAIHFYDKKFYDLIAYCIMPNHVHLVFTLTSDGEASACPAGIKTVRRTLCPESTEGLVRPNEKQELAKARSKEYEYPVAHILRLIKGRTAREANKILNRTGAFWQHENYDHVIRNEKEMEHYIQYTLNNPVNAGLVKNWKNWQWSYCKYYDK
ncbi:MAG: hypothetical protein L0Y76_06800 [Ignavibacteria bacterium]|nr:hypothetical protein [Ignavibacteria bacterium]